MNLDHSIDHCVWDSAQPVILERVTKSGLTRVGIPIAKRRGIRSAQKSPSGGVYLGAESNWHIPRTALPEGVVPHPRDVIIEDAQDDSEVTIGAGTVDEARWTILTVVRNRQGETYACGCVDLVVAHHLADVITVQKPSYNETASGVREKVWDKPGRPVRARVQELSREVSEDRGARQGRLRYDVIIDRQIDVDVAEDRVRWMEWNGTVRYLDIVRVRNPERIDELPVLECELR